MNHCPVVLMGVGHNIQQRPVGPFSPSASNHRERSVISKRWLDPIKLAPLVD